MPLPIPQPPTVPFLGNTLQIDKEVPLNSFMLLSKEYGPIYQLSFPGRTSIFVSDLELIDQVCDQKHFHKAVRGALAHVRSLTGDGLFTAFHGEKNWGIAHRILMPAFGPGKIRGMFHAMTDIASQLIAKWERYYPPWLFGPDYAIEPTEDFTRLTFDTIALCAMSYRLNSFYSLDTVPFITAMHGFLVESGRRSQRPGFVQNYLASSANAQFEADKKTMMDVTHGIIRRRKESGTQIDDLLGLMLTAKDPQTGEMMTDDSIAGNLVTMLIAGHETTSGLLSFAVSHLLANPAAYAKVRAEVDEVLGKEPVKPDHLGKLVYLDAVLRETLRITPSVPIFTLEAFEDTVVTTRGKEYMIPKDAAIQVLVAELHRDANVWGEDVDKFRPERMLNGGFERAPKNSWKPWGNGIRACIGRPLAWQEALICLASVFQKFDLVLNDPDYKLHLKSSLTIKPADLRIRAIPREGAPQSILTSSPVQTSPTQGRGLPEIIMNGVPLHLAYGSNSGTCKDFAQRIGTEASAKGFAPRVVTLDSIESKIPTDGPLVVITASYEGEPADNAGRFVQTLKRTQGVELANVRFAVFGCGHHDWVQTYQQVPTLIDNLLFEHGGERLLQRAEADSGVDEFFDVFDNWVPKLWDALGKAYGDKVHTHVEAGETLSVEIMGTTRAKTLKTEEASGLGTVIENRLLTKPGVPTKHHIEIALPPNVTYHSGDYLAILPNNPAQTVRRVISRFGLASDQQIMISSAADTFFPTNIPISIREVLTGYVELAQAATRKNIQELMKFSPETTARKLQALVSDYKSQVLDKHLSVLDILEIHHDIDIPFASYLRVLSAMRVRQYSISSSPLWNPEHVTLTISVVEAAAASGGSEKFLGVASNFLANLRPGDRINVGVRNSSSSFHLPKDTSVPVVMFAAGSGLAPMRGFIQERAIQVASGRQVGKVILYYGCRSPEQDFLYAEDEFKLWSKLDFLDIRPTFSRATEKSSGFKYIQDRVVDEPDVIDDAYVAGAKFYTCGSPSVANGIKDALLKLIKRKNPDWDDERLEQAWDRIQSERLATDVFA